MLLGCTDVSRKIFKYIDVDNKIKDDIDCRKFIEIISKPVINITIEKYNEMLSEINKELSDMQEGIIPPDNDRRELLNFKKDDSIVKLQDMHNFSNYKKNQEFIKEMSILTKI